MSFSSRRRNYMLKRHRRDGMFEFFREMLNHSFVLDAMTESAANTWTHFEQLINEHRLNRETSRLSELVPTAGDFFTPLLLRSAWNEYDSKYCVSNRRYVNVTFNEIRHIANLAQIMAFSPTAVAEAAELKRGSWQSDDPADNAAQVEQQVGGGATTTKTTTTTTKSDGGAATAAVNNSSLKLITFDGDCTLYSDGASMKHQDLANALVDLILSGVRVGLVTAAGYGHDAPKYEARVQLLLDTLERHPNVNEEAASRFFVLGGECNFLLHCRYELDAETGTHRARLYPDTTWLPDELRCCSEEEMQSMLDVAESTLRQALSDLSLTKKALILRKTRAVGMIQRPNEDPRASKLRRESLDECVLRVQHDLRASGTTVPYCAFNGGNDCFIDIGNKRVGVRGLQSFFGFSSAECLHVGDQFLNTGNDFAARSCCPTVWVTSPKETFYIVRRILKDVENDATELTVEDE